MRAIRQRASCTFCCKTFREGCVLEAEPYF